MSMESDAAKWKSNISRILEMDPEGILLTGAVKKYFDEVAVAFEKGVFDPENTKKQLKILRGRNTRLSGKPIAEELSSFIIIAERYATKTEFEFADFATILVFGAQHSRRNALNDLPSTMDDSLSDLDDFLNALPLDNDLSRISPYITPIETFRLDTFVSIENIQRQELDNRVIENPFAGDVEEKSILSWFVGIILILLVLGLFFTNMNLNKGTKQSVFVQKNNNSVVDNGAVEDNMFDIRDGKTYKTIRIDK